MNREQAEKLLAALIFDDLDETSKSELLAYLQSDDELREHLADMRMAVKVASDTVGHGPEPVLGQKRMKKLEKLAGRRSKWPVIFTVQRLASAAAVLLIVAVSAIVMFNQTERRHAPDFVASEPPAVRTLLDDADMKAADEAAQIVTGEFDSDRTPSGEGITFSDKYANAEDGRNVLFTDSHVDFQKYAVTAGDDDVWAYWNGGTIRGGTSGSISNDASDFINGDAPDVARPQEPAPGGGWLYAEASGLQTFAETSEQDKEALIDHRRPSATAGSSPVDAAGEKDAMSLYARGTGGGMMGGMERYGYGDATAGGSSSGNGAGAMGTGGPYGGGMGMTGFGGMGGMGRAGGAYGMGGYGGYGGGGYGYGGYGGGGYGGGGYGGGGYGDGSTNWGVGSTDSFGMVTETHSYNGQAPGIQGGDTYTPPWSGAGVQYEAFFNSGRPGVTLSTNGRVATDIDGDGVAAPVHAGKPVTVTGPAAVPPSQPVTGPGGSADMPALRMEAELAPGQTVTLGGGSEKTFEELSKRLPPPGNRPVAMDVDFGTKSSEFGKEGTEPAVPADREMGDFDANGRRFSSYVPHGWKGEVTTSRGPIAYDPATGEYRATAEHGGTAAVAPKSTAADDTYIPPWSGQGMFYKDGGETHQGIADSQSGEVSQEAQISPPELSVASRATSDDMWTGTVAAMREPESGVKRETKTIRGPAAPARGPVSVEEAERIPVLGDVPIVGGLFRGEGKKEPAKPQDIKEAQEKFHEQMERDRATRVAELMESARANLKDGKHEAAIGQLQSLLALDGKDAEAGKLKASLEILAQQGGMPGLQVLDKQDNLSALKTDASGIPHADEITYPKNWREIVARPDNFGVAEESADDKSKPESEPVVTDYLTTADTTATGLERTLQGRLAGPVGQEQGGVSASTRPADAEYEIIELKHIDAQAAKEAIEHSIRNLPGTEITEIADSIRIEVLPQDDQVSVSGRDDMRETVKKMVSQIDVPHGEVATEQTGESAESEFAEEDTSELPPASRFKVVPVNPWVMTERDSLSTFALDVDTASYAMCRRYIRAGFKPPQGAVRMEEFVNYFNYHYPQRANPTFAVHAEAAPSPFARAGENLTLLKIGVKARTIGRDQRKAAHLVFVVDASASMGQADRLPLVQYALNLLVNRLSDDDRVTLITCSNEARLHMETVPAGERDRITQAISAIQPSGPTNLLAGLKLGYAVARRSFAPQQVNHVVLCSDGVANVGQTEADALLKEVDEDRKQGITITCVGVGYGSYNDVLMEALANRGDGSYVFLDSAQQARRVFVEQLAATLHTVAKDARIQVDFNPQRVRRYRLIGYENRDIEDKRFRDDTIDAGEVGSGQCSTALYELELIGGPSAAHGEIGTVYVRYLDVETGMIDEISSSIESEVVRRHTVESAPRFFLAAGAARFAELLRESEHTRQTSYAEVLNIADQVSIALPLDGDVRELVDLVRKAEHLPKAP